MGVKNLWDIVESCKKTLPLHHLQNKRVCVDLSCWVVQLHSACKAPSCAREKVYLRSLFHRLRALIALNCSLIFVTDGSIPAIKLSAYRRRLGPTNEITPDEANLRHVSSLPRNLGSEFSCMIKEAKMLGSALGIPCLNALEEAEAQCALLNSELLCDGCFSSDSDAFLFGARTVYRDIYLGEGGYVVCYEMADIERYLGFGRNSLIALALLLGSDYSQGVHGLGRETACSIIKSVGDDTVLHQIASEGISFLRKAKSSKNKGQNMNFNGCKEEGFEVKQAADQGSLNDQFLQVIDAYKKPKCHSPDSIDVERVFIPHTLQLSQLHQLCEKHFDWTPDKTDEYILPKIAERDLRRFANLRNSSAVLGAQIPLNRMPVTCPVSTIVKQRKQHGKECFEVSWESVHGLRTSIVAADLVESACPEKIVEYFNEKLVGKKKGKKKTRPKASANKSSMDEIETQLKGMLLDGELQTKELVCQATGDRLLSPRNVDREIIDLSTPLQVSNARSFDKRLEPIIPKNDVIDIYDSESDVSPEHARKAVELRLFLASIKDDIF